LLGNLLPACQLPKKGGNFKYKFNSHILCAAQEWKTQRQKNASKAQNKQHKLQSQSSKFAAIELHISADREMSSQIAAAPSL